MAKKKIIYVLYSLGIGGVEKSLLNLVNTLDPETHDMHVAVLEKKEGFESLLPAHVTLHKIHGYESAKHFTGLSPRQNIISALRRADIAEAVRLSAYMIADKSMHNRLPYLRHTIKRLSPIDGYFDEAHAYAGPSEIIDMYVSDKINARHKYGWIHFDISNFGIKYSTINRLYPGYTAINIVSKSAKDVFDKSFPSLAHKTVYSPNIINTALVKEMADHGESFDDGFDGTRILTVGRLSPEKGQDIAIRALSLIAHAKSGIRWYFIGDGIWKEHCMRLADELGIGENAVFLGAKANPYPYMRDCDLYAQTSRHEGFCITLGEALSFDKPIVSTDVCGAREQLGSNPHAVICQPTPEDLSSSLLDLLHNLEPIP